MSEEEVMLNMWKNLKVKFYKFKQIRVNLEIEIKDISSGALLISSWIFYAFLPENVDVFVSECIML